MTEIRLISNKDSNKFFASNRNIIREGARRAISEVTDYADLTNCFDCIVRDRLSKKASTNSPTGIFKSIASLSRVSRDGICLQLNHTDQLEDSTFVRRFKSLYDSFKNSSLVSWLSPQTYIKLINLNGTLIVCNNRARLFSRITRSLRVLVYLPTSKGKFIDLVSIGSPPARHRLGDSHAEHLKTKRNTIYEYNKPKGRLASPSFTMPSFADMGGIA